MKQAFSILLTLALMLTAFGKTPETEFRYTAFEQSEDIPAPVRNVRDNLKIELFYVEIQALAQHRYIAMISRDFETWEVAATSPTYKTDQLIWYILKHDAIKDGRRYVKIVAED